LATFEQQVIKAHFDGVVYKIKSKAQLVSKILCCFIARNAQRPLPVIEFDLKSGQF
jgi:hypothetical protein